MYFFRKKIRNQDIGLPFGNFDTRTPRHDLAMIKYDFYAEDSGELTVKQGDVVNVLKVKRDDWTLVSTAMNKKVGHVPTQYLYFIKPEREKREIKIAEAIHNFNARNPVEMTVRKGDKLFVMDERGEWVYVKLVSSTKNIKGYVPRSFLVFLDKISLK